MSRISLSRKHARRLLDVLERARAEQACPADYDREADELRAALAPRPKRVLARKQRAAVKERKRATKRDETSAIYEAVMKRADGVCECGCGNGEVEYDRLQLDHFAGRVRIPQSVESCWALLAGCHARKTGNWPSAQKWLEVFLAHSERHGLSGPAQDAARARLDALRLTDAAAAVSAAGVATVAGGRP